MSDALQCSRAEMRPVPVRLPLRLYMLRRGVRLDEALNCGKPVTGGCVSGVAERLKAIMNRMKAYGLDINRGRVDYPTLADSPVFSDFQNVAAALRDFDPSTLRGREEKIAFWINIYNVLLIHGLIAYGARRSARDVRGVFVRCAYNIGGLRNCLDDIEHGILRGNRMHFVVPGERFARNDPRQQHTIRELDPRIHFALVCGAISCPPIGIHQADKLYEQLDVAARSFVNNGGIVLNKSEMTVSLSRIFQWYSVDFGGSWMGTGGRESVLSYASHFIEVDRDREFVRENAKVLQVKYQEYDWSLNV